MTAKAAKVARRGSNGMKLKTMRVLSLFFGLMAFLVVAVFIPGCGGKKVYHSPRPPKPVPTVSVLDQYFMLAEKQGIQLIRVGDTVKMVMPSDALFYARSANLTPKGKHLLDTTAAILHEAMMHISAVKVSGYTDNEGNPERLRLLSSRQAAAVVKYLTVEGVPAHFLYAVGQGKNDPISRNTSARGRHQNRRVEVLFQQVHFGENWL